MNQKNIEAIIAGITNRNRNLFLNDIEANKETLRKKVSGKSALVIGGAGSIGSAYIKELIKFDLKRLYVIDTNENGLAELVRDIRSSDDYNKLEIKTYPLSFASSIFERILKEQGPFEIVANFAALKHVRSEKDEYAIQAMFENNFINANKLLAQLKVHKPENFFCVSTDKATNPVSIMGATKKLMEDVIFAYEKDFNITTARFANVAFSNGSLLDSYVHRFEKKQPIVCPSDVNRYFVSPEEAGSLCLLACLMGESGDIFIPKLTPEEDLISFEKTVREFFKELNIELDLCESEEEAKEKAKAITNSKISPYPVFLFKTDTSGEKLYEEFYTKTDVVDWNTFNGLGIIKKPEDENSNVNQLLIEAEALFSKDVSKNSILTFLSKYINGFVYEEKGKNLDQKM